MTQAYDSLAKPVTQKGFGAFFPALFKGFATVFRKPLELVNCGVA